MKKNSSFVTGLLTGVLIAVILFLVPVYGSKFVKGVNIPASKGSGSVITKDVQKKMDTIKQMVDNYYLDDIDQDAMREGIYKGALEALGDPYTTYYTKEEFEDLMESTSGTFYGVGMYLSQDPDTKRITVVRPIKDSPAIEAGILKDDVLTEVDHESIEGQELEEVVAKVKGMEGTKVVLTLVRGGKSMDFDLIRRKVEAETVDYSMKEDNTGYISIAEFDDVTTRQFEEALSDLEGQGMDSLIIDLRGNPGGNLDVVVDISEQLLPKGMIVYTEDKNGKGSKYRCDGKNEFKKPLVVLVDGNSASASEILSGAIKDYKIGTLVGTKTFGKGIVQKIIPLDDGTAIKLTISKYFTPSGQNIHGIGIEPDVEVEFDSEAYKKDETDNQLNKALEILKEKKSK